MPVRIKKDLQFKDYIHLLLDNKYLIVFTIVCFMVPTWYFLSKVPDSYDAYSQLAIEESEETLFILTPTANKKTIGYYTGIFQGRAFQEKLLNSLDSNKIPGKNFSEKISFLASNISIGEGSFNTFIKIKGRTQKAKLSYEIVKTATDSLLTFCRDMENLESSQAIKAIKEHIKGTSEKYNEALKRKNEISQNEIQGAIRGLTALQMAHEKQLVAFELKNAEYQAKKAFFTELDKKIKPKNHSKSKSRLKLREKLVGLNKEKRKKMELGLPLDSALLKKIRIIETDIKIESKKASKVNTEIALINKWKQSKKDLLQTENDIKFKKNKIAAFETAIKNFKESHPDIIHHELEINRLNELIRRYEDTHKRLTEKLEDELIKMRAQTGGLTMVEPPFLPSEPIKKNDLVFYILSLFLGTCVGVGLSLFRTFMDDSIKSPEDIEKNVGLPLVGTIPHIVINKSDLLIKRKTDSKSPRDLAFRYPELILKGGIADGIITESYRSFRTNLLFSNPDKPLKAFIVTSCGPHEGKSLTAANTALAFAQQGDPTLLVDTDLRRPICHHLFKIPRNPGVGDIVSKSSPVESLVTRIEGTELDVLPAGLFLPNPAEVLGSKKFQYIVNDLKERYKYIIFDTPPIIAVTDACILSPHVDGVVLITRAEKTSLHALDRSVQNLEKVGANIIGCVLNDVNLTKNTGYYGYYKSYNQYYHTVKD